jgi:DNA-binding response OmpR family regulator
MPPPSTILVVEAERQLGLVLADQLAADGYRVELARTAEHARVLAGASPPEIALLGSMDAPRGTLSLLEEIRGSRREARWNSALPAIVLGDARELDLLRAFEAGADDYLPRPASYLELRARLRALLRRTNERCNGQARLCVGPLEIDQRARVVALNGHAIDLRRLEYELLLHLARDPKRVFARQELLRAVWGYRSDGCSRTLDSHASRLRRKLHDAAGEGQWVINVWGVGYRLM